MHGKQGVKSNTTQASIAVRPLLVHTVHTQGEQFEQKLPVLLLRNTRSAPTHSYYLYQVPDIYIYIIYVTARRKTMLVVIVRAAKQKETQQEKTPTFKSLV